MVRKPVDLKSRSGGVGVVITAWARWAGGREGIGEGEGLVWGVRMVGALGFDGGAALIWTVVPDSREAGEGEREGSEEGVGWTRG